MEQFLFLSSDPLSLQKLLIALGIGVVLSLVLRWHFQRFGSTLSSRTEFAQIFPFIVLTTVLIISVVKSSLALSLGLVGALSIVRFRTPIKEPEELAYLFIAIAIGLGLGADQTVPTVASSAVILAVTALVKGLRRGAMRTGVYCSFDWTDGSDEPIELPILEKVIKSHAKSADLRRYDSRETRSEATYLIDVKDHEALTRMLDVLRRRFPGMGVTIIDQGPRPID